MTPRVLLVQTQPQTAQFLSRFFEEHGDEVNTVLDLGQAATKLAQYKPDLLVLDLHFPGTEWQTFLRIVRVEYPELKIIVTSKYPDVDRELRAQEIGVKAFVRQPFTIYSLNKALDTVGLPSNVDMLDEPEIMDMVRPGAVRVPVRLKITVPLLLMTLLFALAGAYIVSQMILQSAHDRFIAQLTDTRILAADWMVREEDSLLQTLRLITHSQGVTDMMRESNAEALRLVVLPIAVNTDEEAIEILDVNGVSILSMLKKPGGNFGDYDFSRGNTAFQEYNFVQAALHAETDAQGDKFAGLVDLEGQKYFYISSTLYDENDQVIGAVLVGRTLDTLAARMQNETMAEVTFYDGNGGPVVSTLFSERESFPLAFTQVQELINQEEPVGVRRDLQLSNASYTELIGAWEARGGTDLGLMSVSIPQAFLIRSGQLARFEIFAVIAAGILLVVAVGFYLAGLVTAPVRRLAQASSQVAQGNLEVKMDVNGNDEMAAMAQTFNYMVTGLQEGVIYRDLLGQSASPFLREQMRQTLSSGNLRLEGQEVVATVLTSAVRGFTEMAEQNDPVKIFEWLNEYFSQLVPIMTAHAGVVNKFDGDKMVAFFGILPKVLTPKDSAVAACETAIEMLHAIEELNAHRMERGDPAMITSIGINTGKVIAGGLGSGDRLHFTIMGESVNTTYHLESLTRDVYRANGILISQATFAALNDCTTNFHLEPLGLHPVKGKMEKILVYRLLSPVVGPETKVML